MKVGTLFRIKGSDNIYRVKDGTPEDCVSCCAYGKWGLCRKMPPCKGTPDLYFVKLSSYEVRQAKKTKQSIIEY